MRPIKFRVWDREAKKWLEHGSSCLIEAVTGQVVHTFCPLGPNMLDCGHLELVQFIGLHDKNGTEIYEGDIVECATRGFRYPIIFASGRFGCEYHGAAVPPDVPERWTVIGNIYENPELLEAK